MSKPQHWQLRNNNKNVYKRPITNQAYTTGHNVPNNSGNKINTTYRLQLHATRTKSLVAFRRKFQWLALYCSYLARIVLQSAVPAPWDLCHYPKTLIHMNDFGIRTFQNWSKPISKTRNRRLSSIVVTPDTVLAQKRPKIYWTSPLVTARLATMTLHGFFSNS